MLRKNLVLNFNINSLILKTIVSKGSHSNMSWYLHNKSISSFLKHSSTVKKIAYRTVHTGTSQVKELQIPVSYGHLAAKSWGNESGQPVLAFHGWLDNCGTFDRLIPLLPDKFHYIGIDAPGHGKSSHKPPGAIYTDMDFVIDFKKVANHLGMSKCHLIGHSMGGAMATLFSCTFPDMIQKVVLLDVMKPFSLDGPLVLEIAKRGVDEYMRIENKLLKTPPVYDYDAALERFLTGHHDEITKESAEVLLKRGVKPSPCGKGLVFSRDLRCRTVELISVKSHEMIQNFMSNLHCELLIIMAKNTNPFYQPDTEEVMEKFCNMYKQNAKKFVLERVEGNHFVHLNNPERVAPIISKFLLE